MFGIYDFKIADSNYPMSNIQKRQTETGLSFHYA